MSKIIFLDMDGVLCTGRASISMNEKGLMRYLDPVGCNFIQRLVVENNAQVVISSTWRHEGRRAVANALSCAGFQPIVHAFHEDWCTPTFTDRDPTIRGREIGRWLDEHDETENYIIIDDDADMLGYQWSRLVNTDCRNGVLLEHYELADKLLKGEMAERCYNCDTYLPEGCGGIFKSDSESCLLAQQELGR